MEYKLILSENEWQQIQSRCKPLDEYAHVFRGAIVGTRRKATLSSQPKEVLWLANARAVPMSFHIVYERSSSEKAVSKRFRKEHTKDQEAFEGTKVLFVRSTDTSWGRRSKVAIERRGYYVSGSYIVVMPR